MATLYLAAQAVNWLQVLVPTSQFIRSLVAARLAADVLDVPTVLIARTDAHSAALLTSDVDEVDRAFCTGERTPEGFFRVNQGVKVSMLEQKLLSGACSDVMLCFVSVSPFLVWHIARAALHHIAWCLNGLH